jgi:hypothetical protein
MNVTLHTSWNVALPVALLMVLDPWIEPGSP